MHQPEPRNPDSAGESRSTLFETTRGSVHRCTCCDRLEVRFGNAMIALTADELPQMLLSLSTAEAESDSTRETTLFLGETGCGWVFSQLEVAELHRLVAGAGLLLGLENPSA